MCIESMSPSYSFAKNEENIGECTHPDIDAYLFKDGWVKLEKAYQDYIALLCDELDDLVSMATVHGWKSTRYERGLELRAEIKQLGGTYRLPSQPPKEEN